MWIAMEAFENKCQDGGEFAWILDPHILWNNCLDSFRKQHSCLCNFKISLFVCAVFIAA